MGKREIKSCSVANWWSLNWLLLKNQILGQNRKHHKKVSSRSGPGQNVKLDISSCLWKWGQQKNHYPAVWLHPGLWMWQWERRQQLTTRTPTPSQPHDILQKCHLSSATDTWKQLMTCGRAITRVKILAFLIHPDEWRSILIREKPYWEVNKQTTTQRSCREILTSQRWEISSCTKLNNVKFQILHLGQGTEWSLGQ